MNGSLRRRCRRLPQIQPDVPQVRRRPLVLPHRLEELLLLLLHLLELLLAEDLGRSDESDGLGETRLGLAADVAIPDHAAVAAADDQVEEAVAVPVGDDGLRVAVRRLDWVAVRFELLWSAEGGFARNAVIRHQI